MDDVWGNAWSQSSDSKSNKPDLAVETPWQFPSPSNHEEADIGLPSWSTGSVNWAEPTGEASLWSSAAEKVDVETSGWTSGTSGFKIHTDTRDEGPNESLASNEQHESESSTARSSSDEEEEHEADVHLSPAENPAPLDSTPSEITTAKKAETVEVISAPGTSPIPHVDEDSKSEDSVVVTLPPTESFDDADLTWSTPVVGGFGDISGEDTWGSAWGAQDREKATNEDEETKDEWALAQEAKLRRDRSVPPELMEAIYDRLNELSDELFPKPGDRQDSERFGNWRDGLSSVEGLESLMQRYNPELPPQPPIQFPKCHVAKAMANSVKLTKNLPLARNSPMAHLFMAKSLAAWELSVKNRVETPQDYVPAGWRIEPEVKAEEKPALVEKKSGGLLSFFSRRTSTVPTAVNGTTTRRSSSLSRDAPSAGSVKGDGTQSSRTSVESSIRSPSAPAPSQVTSEGKLPQSPSVPSTVQPSTEAAPERTSQEPAPSVVSRFFNRFSRIRSDARSNPSSPRSSLALSTNDLEFLSDIVPSHVDEADEDDQLAALSALVSSPPISSKLSAPLPPPLAPPPLPPPTRITQSRPQSRTSLTRPAQVPAQNVPSSNLLADFGDPEPAPPSSSISRQVPVLPPPLPAPLAPSPIIGLSKPPTPANAQNAFRSGSPQTHIGDAAPTPRIASPTSAPFKQSGLSIVTKADSVSATSLPPSASVVTPISALQRQDQMTSLLSSPAAPPPIEKSPNRVFVQNSTNAFDDDDFSDFQSPVTASSVSQPFTRARQQQAPVFGDASYEAPSDQSFLSSHGNTEDDLFGDFADFVSPTTQQPIPTTQATLDAKPLPPSLSRSNSSATIPPPPPKKRVPPEIKTSHIRKPSAAQREAVAHLVERAAEHKGRWPAPLTPIPSPLPAPIPGPSGPSKLVSAPTPDQLLLDLDEPTHQTSAPAPRPASSALKPISQITASVRSGSASPAPAVAPSAAPAVQADTPSLLDLNASFLGSSSTSTPSQPANVRPYASNASKSQSATMPQKGGLSAQDLSFFEGL